MKWMNILTRYKATPWSMYFKRYNFLDEINFIKGLAIPLSALKILKNKTGYFSNNRDKLAKIVYKKNKKYFDKIINIDFNKGIQTTKGFYKYFYLMDIE